MSNIQILYDNVSNLCSSITASTTTGDLVASNMLTEYKGQNHRSTGTSVTYTLIWDDLVNISCVGLPATNLTNTATIVVSVFTTTSGGSALYTTPVKLAAQGLNLNPNTWATDRDVNCFFYGGAAKTFVTFPVKNVRRVVISIVDTGNPIGYIDCSRIVCGEYWQPTYNVQRGLSLEVSDTSDTSRSDSGDSITDTGILFDKISFDFSILPESDRTTLVKLMKRVGIHKNIFVNVLPNDASHYAEQDFMIYGKRNNSSTQYQVYGFYNSSMEITGW